MSAFVVEDHHITYIVQAARLYEASVRINGQWLNPSELRNDSTAQALATQLHSENVKSFVHRYPDEADSDFGAVPWEDQPLRPITPVQTLKALRCYEYQACEHPGWERSDACRNVRNIAWAAIAHLPGYEAALWGAPEYTSTTRARRII